MSRPFVLSNDVFHYISLIPKLPKDACVSISPAFVCTAIVTDVVVTHKESLISAEVTFALRMQHETLTKILNSVPGLEAKYDGDILIESEILVILEGNFTSLTADERLYFEEVTQAYLFDQLVVKGVNILGVYVLQQSLAKIRRKLQRSSSTLILATTITGEYRPPPDVDFDSAVTDALDSDSEKQYRDELSSGGRVRPEGLPTFADIQNSYAKKNSTASPTASPTDDGNEGHSLRTIAISAGCVVILLLLRLYWWMRSRRRRKSLTILYHNGGVLKDIKCGWFGRSPNKISSLFKGAIIDAECVYGVDVPTEECAESLARRLAYGAKFETEKGSGRTIQSNPLDQQLALYNSKSMRSWATSPTVLSGEDRSHVSRQSFELPSHLQQINKPSRSALFESSMSTLGFGDDSDGRFDDEETDEYIKPSNGQQSRRSLLIKSSPLTSKNDSRRGLDFQRRDRLDRRFSSDGNGRDYRDRGTFINRMQTSMPSSLEIDERAIQSALGIQSSQNIVGQGKEQDKVEQQQRT